MRSPSEKVTPEKGFWPAPNDYQEAMTAPAACLADPELQSCVIADRTPFGLPQPIAGQFANVYRLQSPTAEAFAARVFLQGWPDRDAHFHALAEHFDSLPQLPPFLLPFEYQTQGIQIRGERFPLLKQAWIDGLPLNLWAERNLYASDAFRQMAAAWRDAMRQMTLVRFAHGDLQHGNILIDRENRLRLIDYDAAFVPSRSGRPLREMGHPAYQHPRRTIADYNPGMDKFAALLIYSALRALAVAPDLWYRLDTGDNLLFRPEDLTHPADSRGFRIFREALTHHPAEYRLIRRVRDAIEGALNLIPELDHIERAL